MTEKDIRKRHIKMSLILALLVGAICIWQLSLSWFADNSSVTATGASVSVSTVPELVVRTDITDGGSTTRVDVGDYTADGAVEGTDYYEVPLLLDETTLSPSHKIVPGSEGSFTVYLEYTGTDEVTFNPVLSVQTDRIAEAGDSNDAIESARRYANSHFVFTCSDESNEPITSISLQPNVETEFHVNWIWVENYGDFPGDTINSDNYEDYLFGIDSSFDASADTDNIDAYNKADTFIARYMTPLYFHLEFESVNAGS